MNTIETRKNTNKRIASEVRASIKSIGYTDRDVSVTSCWDRIVVEIKSTFVSYEKVSKIVDNRRQIFEREEILGGHHAFIGTRFANSIPSRIAQFMMDNV